MKIAVVAVAFAAMTCASAAGAQPATDPSQPPIAIEPPPDADPELAGTVALYSAPGVLLGRSGWNRILESGGYEPLDAFAGELGARAAIQLSGLELAVVPSYALGVADDTGRRRFESTSVFAEAAYDLHASPSFTLAPSVGLGWQRSSLCFTGEPDAVAPEPRGSPISQILRAPGRESCLDSDHGALRLGFAFGIASYEQGGLLFARIRPTFTIPFASSTYRLDGQDLPPLAGPAAPHVSFAVNVEVGFGVGAGRRRW
jgi:hypothetical protein